ncbi:uncharacterized protein LOC117102757 [Anneissia japonica]|uniref:uncharacterized protein LOC117102757 n=1 Tax=Anneissia japonica TaxID=1529436 RepID=UPI0014256ACA|nr:uncharacterized protein LOC117102757 [Anneissia japonica]
MCGHNRLRMFLMFICCYMLSNIQLVICAQITLRPQNVIISAGMEATFKCIVRLSRDITDGELAYDVGWWSGGISIANGNGILIRNRRYSINRTQDLKPEGKYVYSTLKITEVKHADAGHIICVIIQETKNQASAWLIVKQVPEPQCMPLPRSVTTTDVITLSCMIGPGNYVTRLTWYAGDNTDYINTRVLSQTTVKSYLNNTVAVTNYVNGTIFKCVAEEPNDRKLTETCSTNPLNIVENEVKVHALSLLPLTAGNQACFECTIFCVDCVGLRLYTWAFNGSAIQSPTSNYNRICFTSVPLIDDGQPLRCTASFGIEIGVDELVLQVVNTMTTDVLQVVNTMTTESQHPTAMTHTIIDKLPNLRYNSCITPIIVTIVSMLFLILLIIIGFIIFYKRQINSKTMAENLSEEYQVPDNTHARKRKGRHNSTDSSPNVLTNSMYQQLNLNQIQSEETLMQEQHYINVK